MEKKENENFVKNEVFDLIGYQPITTFWQDFSVADMFGNSAITDTYRRAKSEWKDNYKYWTELCMVLNHKLWYWYDHDNMQLSRLYDKLWKDADSLTAKWPEEAQQYYYKVTD